MRAVIKIGALFLALSIFVVVQADDGEKKELKSTMHSFYSALELIQHGILYNKKDEMYKGAQLLERNEQKFIQRHGNALRKHFPKDQEFAYAYAETTSKRIVSLTKKLNDSLGGSQDFSNIAATYGHIFQACVGCHQKLRNK